jgi:hypothetical protein
MVEESAFVAMRPAQKYESPGFQITYDNAFAPTYFHLRGGVSAKSHLQLET